MTFSNSASIGSLEMSTLLFISLLENEELSELALTLTFASSPFILIHGWTGLPSEGIQY